MLGDFKIRRAVQPLADCLLDTHRDSMVRREAAISQGKLGDPAAVGPLLRVLGDRDTRLSLWATYSLRKLGVGEAKLTFSMRADSPLAKGEYGRVAIVAHNSGLGPALDIEIALNGPFDRLRNRIVFSRLEVGATEEVKIEILPKESGASFPVELKAAYWDASGRKSKQEYISLVVRSDGREREELGAKELLEVLKSLGTMGEVPKEFVKQFMVLLAPTEQKARLVAELGKLEKQAGMDWEQILGANMGSTENASVAEVFKALASQAGSLRERLNREELSSKDDAFRMEMKDMVEKFLEAQREVFQGALQTLAQVAQRQP